MIALLSACSSANAPEPSSAHTPTDTPIDAQAAMQPGHERPSVPPLPASAASGVPSAQAQPVAPSSLLTASALLGNPSPDSYAFREDAKRLAIELAQRMALDPQWVWDAISRAKVKDSAARLMMPAPAGTAKNWAVYRSRFIDAQRIRAGVQFWRDNEADLRRAEARYGVPAHIIAGVIGVETIYGRNMGKFRILDALTTLSLDFPKGRSDRSAFFQSELGHYLKLCAEQQQAPESMLGSYAGAIGLPQFMPSSIRNFAVDFDEDGRIDLIGNTADAIGSVAHFLAVHGWQSPWPAYFDITPPADPSALGKLLGPDIVPSFLAQEMLGMGAKLPPDAQNHPGKLALVRLENGRAAPTLIAGTQNFYAITRYNQSSYYALAVVQLGEAVARQASRQLGLNP